MHQVPDTPILRNMFKQRVATQTPWAILRCKWSDHDDEPESDAFFERLFTPAGAGTRNMVEFFDMMSHGKVDLSGSRVFGWFTLSKEQSDYAGNVDVAPAGQINRQGLVDLAKSTAIRNGVELSRFYGVVVCMNTLTDLFGGGGIQALCDPGSFRPTVLGQEMGHGYGLGHSRIAGSTDDYRDPWDVMSTWDGCHIASDRNYTQIGPGINAANMRGRGWLAESRVWHSPESAYSGVVQLRPLHRRDLPGHLAAQAGEFLVEFRVQDGWDAAIPRSAVLVHSFGDNRSYIQPGTNGNLDLVAGDVFEMGNSAVTWVPYTRVEVQSIDAERRTATIHIVRRIAKPPHYVVPGADLFGGIPVDGGGIIIVGGRVVPVPPWDPSIRVLENMAAFHAVSSLRDTAARDSVRIAVMQELVDFAGAQLEQLEHLETPRAPTEERFEHGTDAPANGCET